MTVNKREAGIVSLMVTLVMMVVITLIVLGFAEIARNEQRSSLDDQLSTQAYYAAESGINDARSVIDSILAGGGQPPSRTTACNQAPYNLNNIIDPAHGVSYTCLLVNTAPTTLSDTAGFSSTVIPLISGAGNFGTLSISWQVAAGETATAAGCDTLLAQIHNNPPLAQWFCHYPMLRVDLLDANGVLSRANWANATTTVFMMPYNSMVVPNSIPLGLPHGFTMPADCNAASCTGRIIGLGGTKYYLRLTTIYLGQSNVTISAGGVPFIDSEAVIDSTGQAQDVLRRVVVAVDLTNANADHWPSAAIITRDSVCKRFAVTNGSFSAYGDLNGGDGGNILCNFAPPTGVPSP